MYNMERFATQVYLSQRRAFKESSITEKLDAAAENEREHVDLLWKRIVELQGNQSRIGFLFQTVGRIISNIAGTFGQIFVLKVDVFVESRAISDYNSFLKKVHFDEDTVKLIRQLIDDEIFHKENWETSIEELKSRK